MAGVEACRHCGSEVLVRAVVSGEFRPFDRHLQPVGEVPELGRFVPVQRSGTLVMVLSSDLPPAKADALRWVATRHTCAAGLRAWHESNERRRFATELASMWGVPVSAVMDRWDLAEAEQEKDPDRHATLHAYLVEMHREITEAEKAKRARK